MTTRRRCLMGPRYRFDDGKTGNDLDYESYGEKRRDDVIWRSNMVLGFTGMSEYESDAGSVFSSDDDVWGGEIGGVSLH